MLGGMYTLFDNQMGQERYATMRIMMNILGTVFVFAGIAIGMAEYMIYGFSPAIVLGNVMLIVIGVMTLYWAEDVRDSLLNESLDDFYHSQCYCRVCRLSRSSLNG